MSERKLLKFNHTNIVSKNKNKKNGKNKQDNTFNEMTNELRTRLIDKNKISNTIDKKVETQNNCDINNFDNAIKFLEKIREKRKKKEKGKHRTTVKCHTNTFPESSSTQETTRLKHLKEEPKCGILKNGSKPLWRDYHKTRKRKLQNETYESSIPKNTLVEPMTVEPMTVEPMTVEPMTVEPMTVEPMTVEPMTVEPMTVEPMTVEPMTVEPITVEPIADSLSQKVKVKLGKIKSKLHVLLQTRKIKKKSNRYTQKNTLKTHGFINSTSKAPDDVIELMYDSMVGDDNNVLCNVIKN